MNTAISGFNGTRQKLITATEVGNKASLDVTLGWN